MLIWYPNVCPHLLFSLADPTTLSRRLRPTRQCRPSVPLGQRPNKPPSRQSDDYCPIPMIRNLSYHGNPKTHPRCRERIHPCSIHTGSHQKKPINGSSISIKGGQPQNRIPRRTSILNARPPLSQTNTNIIIVSWKEISQHLLYRSHLWQDKKSKPPTSGDR